MKKSTKTPKTEAPTAQTASPTAQTTPTGPSVKAIMYRIATLTSTAAKRVKVTDADPATVYAYALSQIDAATVEFWKHHNA